MPMTDLQIRNIKPGEKRQRLLDRDNLYIEVMVSGKKIWRFRYYRDGKQSWHTIGDWPTVGLQEARERSMVLRQRVRDGLPLKEEKRGEGIFSDIALEWADAHDRKVSNERDRVRVRTRLKTHVFPFIGKMDITEIQPQDVLSLLKRLEAEEKFEMLSRVRSMISQIFRYAAANGKPVTDPTYVLRGAITVPKKRHYASVTNAAEVGALLRSIWAYPQEIVREAMKFSAYTFCRPGEIRKGEWSEVDFDNAEWRIDASKMKMRRVHIVPLSNQALAILKSLHPRTGHGRYIFPSARNLSATRPMSENGVLVALRSMGYEKDQMTPHGFRSMASTLLNENGFNRDHIERQLAHIEGNQVRAAYNYAEYLPERRMMMQWYADYLDSLREGTEKPDRPISV